MKKECLRMCISCKELKPKKELIRIVKDDNNIFIDSSGKANGRGTYICNDDKCLDSLIKNKLLNKIYKSNLDENTYLKIKGEILANRKN